MKKISSKLQRKMYLPRRKIIEEDLAMSFVFFATVNTDTHNYCSSSEFKFE